METIIDFGSDSIVGRSAASLASALGVSRQAVEPLDLAFSKIDDIPDSDVERRELLDELRGKYD